MAASHGSALLDPLFSDPELARELSDAESLRAMAAVEGALARAEAKLGVIPADAAASIERAVSAFEPDMARIAAGVESAGIPVLALVQQLRAAAGPAGRYLHWGATTQDIMDTGLVLRLRRILAHLDAGLAQVIGHGCTLARAHRGTLMAARTRSQQALPTTFGLKVAGWLTPLVRHRERLAQLRPRLLVVQFGGAAGTLAALGDRGLAVAQALADELELGAPVGPWHVQRDAFVELAGWLSLVSGSLGKIGQDVASLAQSEVAELREGGDGRGGSSTMPQKVNPVSSEVLITVARMNAALLASMHQALLHEHERGGAAWQLEWLALPQMASLTGAALRHAAILLAGIEVRAERMRTNIDASNGLLLAEAAAFALARAMPLEQAQALVKEACLAAEASGRHLVDVLRERSDAAIDWHALRDPVNYLGATDTLIDRAIAAAAPLAKLR
jgi:3-carboxy-cis,cis-muconate cycloisomerase